MTDKEVNEYLDDLNNKIGKREVLDVDVLKHKKADEYAMKSMNNLINVTYLKNDLGLINDVFDDNKTVSVIYLTPKGKKVLRLGGWIKYLEREEEIEMKKEQKENYDLRISKLQANTSWFPYLVSIIGIGLSIWALYRSN